MPILPITIPPTISPITQNAIRTVSPIITASLVIPNAAASCCTVIDYEVIVEKTVRLVIMLIIATHHEYPVDLSSAIFLSPFDFLERDSVRSLLSLLDYQSTRLTPLRTDASPSEFH